jgi:hypothetical protein
MFDLKEWGRGKRFRFLEPQPIVKKQEEKIRANWPIHPYIRGTPQYFRDDEYHKYHKGPFECGNAYGAYLTQKGYDHLGSGSFSTVYGKEGKDRVIKVSRRLDPWWEFVRWAYDNGHQQFAPKVYSYKYHPGIGEKNEFYVAVVDRLTSHVKTKDDGHAMTKYFFNYMLDVKPEAQNDNIIAVGELLAPGIQRFCEEFANKFKRKRQEYILDCYGHNMMLSVDGKRWVVNDPLCGAPKDMTLIKERYKAAA